MRTVEEIKAKAVSELPEDVLGVIRNILISALPWKEAESTGILNGEITEEQWSETIYLDESGLREEAKTYFQFSVNKAENHRGISASRSVQKYQTWIWLLLSEEHYQQFKAIAENRYAQYGVPALELAATMLGFPDEWQRLLTPELARMAQGKYCSADCNDGCGL